jgi:zinc and cadmium transporter
MNEAFLLLGLSLVGSVLALIGGVLFLYIKKWRKLLCRYSIPFAAGVLLTTAFVGLLPEAAHIIDETAFAVSLISFLAAFIFEHFFFKLHHHDNSKEHNHSDKEGSMLLLIVGDTVHNFVDGVAIGASFLASPVLGLTTACSSFLHEVPHEIGDFAILYKFKWKPPKILLVNFVSALSTVVGAFLVYYFIRNDTVVGYLIAIAAGLFFYLGAVDFLPSSTDKETDIRKNLIPLIIGVIVMLAVFSVMPHSH